jgi:hypothetical protein
MFETIMKFSTFLILALLLIGAPAFAQLSDDFSDGNFSANPAWTGTSSAFTVNALSQLQSADVAAGQAYLTADANGASLNNSEWNFWIRQTFAGSDNNQSRFYLSSSSSTLSYTGNNSAGTTGYFLKFGEGGSADAVRLFRDDGTGTPIEILTGSAGSIAASFTARIKITRDAAGLWSLYADYAGGSNFTLQGTGTDNTYTTADYIGWICTYTASNADNFYLDDLYFGEIVVDTTAPSIISAVAIGPTAVDVQFSEVLTALSAQNTANYSITGIASITSATLDGIDPSLVHLTLGSALPVNTDLTLTASNMVDLFDNTMSSDNVVFQYFVAANAEYRDVVFNEILADPDPAVGLPAYEFVELHNPTSEAFNLEGWEFVNSTTVKILPNYNLAPGGFVILCDAANTAFFENAIGIASFTALTNAGDSLTLINDAGTLIDYVAYSDDWFDTSEKLDGGWTLELINPLLYCQSSANWMESQNPNGGTPNATNSVYDITPDAQAPVILGYSLTDANQLIIQFDEAMDQNTLASATINFTSGPAVSTVIWYGGNEAIIITPSGNLAPGATYSIVINGLTDCSGNPLSTAEFSFTIGFLPQIGDIIITEIMADPEPSFGAPSAEYIEIYNKTEQLLDISGMKVNSGTFADQVLLQPGEYMLLGDVDNTFYFIAVEHQALMDGFPGLTNTGGTITLFSANNEIIDEVVYEDSWYQDPSKADGGYSLELINPFDPCSTGSNWRSSNSTSGGTPGAQNSVYDDSPDTTAPYVTYVFSGPLSLVTVLFDEPLDEGILDGITWEVNGETLTPVSISFTDNDHDGLYLGFEGALAGQLYQFEIFGIADCWGNEANNIIGTFTLPQAAQLGDIVINEILSNPFDDGSDFIELYNNSPRAISLSNWALTREVDGALESIDLITEYQLVLYPGEYIVLIEDGSTLSNHYPFTKSDRIWLVEDMPTLNNDEGIVVLLAPDASIMDRVSYNVDMHFALLDDLDGVSLERLDPVRASDEQTNWHSAAQSQGFATPGYLNSQATGAVIAEEQITIYPEIFSPDNDGYQDVVTILYSDDTPGLTVNIYIYDSSGRQVRYLTKNELLGVNSSISWNGITDDGLLAPVGIYIIYLEVFSTDGQSTKIKKTCVLAHKLN